MSAPIEPARSRRPSFLPEYPRTRAVLLTAATILAIGFALQMIASAGALTSSVLIPSAVAILLAALLMPIQILFNHRLKLPRGVAAALTLVVGLGLVSGIVYVAGASIADGIDNVREVAAEQLAAFQSWLTNSGLPIGQDQIDNALDTVVEWLQSNQSQIAEQAAGIGSGAANFLVGMLLCLVGTFFFLAEGDRMASWLIMRMPRRWQERAFEAGRRGWVSIGSYAKTQVIVAAVDAIGIGVGAAILRVEFVIPLTAITFILCFIPMIGAVISGALFVLVALAFQGFGAAVIMLIIVIGVQQLESNFLSPLLMGKAVNIHPVAVLLGVATGTYLFGLVGALFAVPAIAAVNSMSNYLAGRDPFPGLASGGSALTSSARNLVGDTPKVKVPKRLGQATPSWASQARDSEFAPVTDDGDADADRVPAGTGSPTGDEPRPGGATTRGEAPTSGTGSASS
ncbi:putative integral membrane protein [Actinomycetales bacterium JB111]|nr:putative integral membrane protein [Actinomycetales bacterium JB111]